MATPIPSADEPRGFARYRARAASIVASSQELGSLAAKAAAKLAATGASLPGLDGLVDNVRLAIGLTRDWASGRYRGVDRSSMILVVGALVYFVVPLDVIPDFVAGLGFADDAVVLGYVVSRISREIAAYRAWLASRSDAGEAGDGEADGDSNTGANGTLEARDTER